MGNSAFARLLNEFDANYNVNDAFKEYCDSLGIMRTGFYGEVKASAEDMKSTRDFWKKSGHPWYQSTDEAYHSHDVGFARDGFGFWKSEKDELAFLKAYRKAEKKGYHALRNFMRDQMNDPEYEL